MRENSLIRQKALYDYLQNYNKNKPKKEQIWLDPYDAMIFDYILQFCLSENEKIKRNRIVINNTEYTHIAYKKIIEDNPLLYIKTKDKLAKRINKLIKLSLLDKYFAKEKGSKTYFALSPNGYTLIAEQQEGVSPNGERGYSQTARGGIAEQLYNRNINIENNNREIKIENKNSFLYIGSLTNFEKIFLGVIFNLKDLGFKYGLAAYKEKDYLEALKRLLEKDYYDSEILSAIYGRMYKVIFDEIDKRKFLQTIINPNYLVKSIDQLINENRLLVEELMETYKENIDVIENDKIPYQVLFTIYYEDYEKVRELIDDNGYFEDVTGYEYHIKDLEYYIYLMTKFLSRHDIELMENIRSFIVNNLIKVSFYKLLGKLLFGLLYLENENQLEQLQVYSNSKELANFYNQTLGPLEIDKSLDDISGEIENKIAVE